MPAACDHRGPPIFQPGDNTRLDRRALVRSLLTTGAAAGVLFATHPATAFTLEKLPPALLGAIPPRDGVLAWDALAGTAVGDTGERRFSPILSRLDGSAVTIEGHWMALEAGDRSPRFLLTAYRAHCPFCMPGGFASIVAVAARQPVGATTKILAMRGTFRLVSEPGDGLLYRLDDAVPA